jgi:hypothetical protein
MTEKALGMRFVILNGAKRSEATSSLTSNEQK